MCDSELALRLWSLQVALWQSRKKWWIFYIDFGSFAFFFGGQGGVIPSLHNKLNVFSFLMNDLSKQIPRMCDPLLDLVFFCCLLCLIYVLSGHFAGKIPPRLQQDFPRRFEFLNGVRDFSRVYRPIANYIARSWIAEKFVRAGRSRSGGRWPLPLPLLLFHLSHNVFSFRVILC